MSVVAKGTAAMPLMATVDSEDAAPMRKLLFRAWMDAIVQVDEDLPIEERDRIKGSAIVRVTVEITDGEDDG